MTQIFLVVLLQIEHKLFFKTGMQAALSFVASFIEQNGFLTQASLPNEGTAHNNRIAKSGAEEYIIVCISLSASVST